MSSLEASDDALMTYFGKFRPVAAFWPSLACYFLLGLKAPLLAALPVRGHAGGHRAGPWPHPTGRDRSALTLDQISQWLALLVNSIGDGAARLVELAGMIARAVTSDHLEGAAVMALLLLGPSLIIGLLSGFWEGLRIEWRQYRGQPRVIDGDTVEIRGERIRLFGIDTPEIGQPWWDEDGERRDAGRLSMEALSELVNGRRLSVRVLSEDQYRRSVAIVKVDRRDIGRLLVSRGWAFASPGSNRYRRTQASAKRQKKGLWRGELEMPWEYRAAA